MKDKLREVIEDTVCRYILGKDGADKIADAILSHLAKNIESFVEVDLDYMDMQRKLFMHLSTVKNIEKYLNEALATSKGLLKVKT